MIFYKFSFCYKKVSKKDTIHRTGWKAEYKSRKRPTLLLNGHASWDNFRLMSATSCLYWQKKPKTFFHEYSALVIKTKYFLNPFFLYVLVCFTYFIFFPLPEQRRSRFQSATDNSGCRTKASVFKRDHSSHTLFTIRCHKEVLG